MVSVETTTHAGDVWKALISNAEVTQSYVAGRMGISQKHLSQIIHKHKIPSAAHTVAFAHVMGADARRLWAFTAECEIRDALAAFRAKRVKSLPPPPPEWALDEEAR